jgi:hypothetical protein
MKNCHTETPDNQTDIPVAAASAQVERLQGEVSTKPFLLLYERPQNNQVYGAGPLFTVLSPPGWKQATATEDFDFHISYL